MKGKSPYAKYEKRPYKYSQEYYNWREAVKTVDETRIREANEAWHRKWRNKNGRDRYI